MEEVFGQGTQTQVIRKWEGLRRHSEQIIVAKQVFQMQVDETSRYFAVPLSIHLMHLKQQVRAYQISECFSARGTICKCKDIRSFGNKNTKMNQPDSIKSGKINSRSIFYTSHSVLSGSFLSSLFFLDFFPSLLPLFRVKQQPQTLSI